MNTTATVTSVTPLKVRIEENPLGEKPIFSLTNAPNDIPTQDEHDYILKEWQEAESLVGKEFTISQEVDMSKELTDYINQKQTQEECIGFIDGYKAAQQSLPKGRKVWVEVDCKDRLPENGGMYFCLTDKKDEVDFSYFDLENKQFGDNSCDAFYPYRSDRIVCWLEPQQSFTIEDMRKCWYAAREHKHGFTDTALEKYLTSLHPNHSVGQEVEIEIIDLENGIAKIVEP